jgi:hypothetical protein
MEVGGMSDVRKCDGPGCDEVALLDPKVSMMGDLKAESFITVTGAQNGARKPNQDEFHFHNDNCLVKWTRENNRG